MKDQADDDRGRMEQRQWETVMSGAECFRKSNIRLLGNIRLLRFKTGKGEWRELPFHRNETPITTFGFRRMVWAVVRQNGELDERQLPLASEKDVFVRMKLALVRMAQAPLLFVAGLFLKRRKFSHFIMLGCNCELAYRFVKANGFLDSNFFAWAGGLPCAGMLNALRHFDELFTGDMTFANGGIDMFVDVPTKVLMHSRYRSGDGGAMPDIEDVKAEVRSRAAHLREKFYRQLRDDEPTLAVVKMPSSDCRDGDSYAHQFIEQIREMGGRNFQMLVVCQKRDAACFPSEHPDYFLRTVSRFNPDWQIATEQRGDRYGWNLIWREFSPAKIMVQNKKYKFEK